MNIIKVKYSPTGVSVIVKTKDSSIIKDNISDTICH